MYVGPVAFLKVVNTHIHENIYGCFISNKNYQDLFSLFLIPLLNTYGSFQPALATSTPPAPSTYLVGQVAAYAVIDLQLHTC